METPFSTRRHFGCRKICVKHFSLFILENVDFVIPTADEPEEEDLPPCGNAGNKVTCMF